MKLTELFTKTRREAPKDETAVNAQLLTRGGFIYKNSAGIYSFLPFGWRVIQKIAAIIREEMNAIGGQEMFMAALHDKKYLTASGRWDVEVVFKVVEGGKKEPTFNISWTHEEVIAEIAKQYVNSYKDLPFAAYQIQTKFRNEPRAKSGLLRGREFLMKDLYSFHTTEQDLRRYYDTVASAYHKVFERCGLESIYTLAAGGEFTAQNTHEFQVISEVGEDTIYVCPKCHYAENKEISKLKDGDNCPKCNAKIAEKKAIEVGNIFPLGTKYSEALDLSFTDDKGAKKHVVMGSYGIGLGRVMATVVEVYHDDKGVIWPASIAPFTVHLVAINQDAIAEYDKLVKAGIEVLYDDRTNVSAGEKLADADLIGCPLRVVVSAKTADNVELKRRRESDIRLVTVDKVIDETQKL